MTILTNTDVERRLSIPETCLKYLPRLEEGGHSVDLQVQDHESGDVWTFQCSIRDGVDPKPCILSGWLQFVRSKKLQMGDMIKFCWELDQAAGAQYKIEVKRVSRVTSSAPNSTSDLDFVNVACSNCF